jgi:hypothetical protein
MEVYNYTSIYVYPYIYMPCLEYLIYGLQVALSRSTPIA